MRVILCILAGFSLLVTAVAGGDYEEQISKLARDTPTAETDAAVKTLEVAGLDAFPALIAHFDDKRPGDRRFQRAVAERAPDGSWRPHPPTVGDICFDIVEGAIDSGGPKRYRDFQVVTRANVKQWLDAHRGMSLNELRVIAAKESLKRAEAATHLPAESRKDVVEHFRARLKELQK